MSKHQILQLDKLGEEVHGLGFAILIVSKSFIYLIKVYEPSSQCGEADLGQRKHTLSSNNRITNPELASLRLRLAVSINLLLIEGPVREFMSR